MHPWMDAWRMCRWTLRDSTSTPSRCLSPALDVHRAPGRERERRFNVHAQLLELPCRYGSRSRRSARLACFWPETSACEQHITGQPTPPQCGHDRCPLVPVSPAGLSYTCENETGVEKRKSGLQAARECLHVMKRDGASQVCHPRTSRASSCRMSVPASALPSASPPSPSRSRSASHAMTDMRDAMDAPAAMRSRAAMSRRSTMVGVPWP
eukprot:366113-Chlamydomonas_euryale.AAC.25